MSVSASKDHEGNINLTICNSSLDRQTEVEVELRGAGKAADLSGRVLSDEKMNAHNTFDNPENIKPAVFESLRATDKGFKAVILPKSVNAISVRF